jgi:PST family polysaccharide transporter
MSDKNTSYSEILKSTALVGGSQVIVTLISIVRIKFVAVLLGPSGIGLMGMYQSATGMIGTLTGLGVGSSGVRQIAAASAKDDDTRITRSIVTLRRTSMILAVIGMVLTIILSEPLSKITFGDSSHATAFAILSITLFFGAITSGQMALLQGKRQIANIAAVSVFGAILGTVFSIPIIYTWGEAGIVPLIICISLFSILPSWWYARKISLQPLEMSWREVWQESQLLLSLGFVFMASSFVASVVTFLTRIIVIQEIGIDSVGLYIASVTLSSIYIGMVIKAMSMDFYPRLTAIVEDNQACNRLINEQTEVGIFMALPGILATLTFAPEVLHLFYSAEFVAASELVRWMIFGVFLKVMSFPLGYFVVAKGLGRTFFWLEMGYNSIHIIMIWFGVLYFGLIGVGIAFSSMYFLSLIINYLVVRRISGFRWITINLRIFSIAFVCLGIILLAINFLPGGTALALNTFLTITVSSYCLKKLNDLIRPEWFANFSTKLKGRLGIRG